MVKVRKMQSPILITLRNIGVADALVSLLTLQATMLASFRETSSPGPKPDEWDHRAGGMYTDSGSGSQHDLLYS